MAHQTTARTQTRQAEQTQGDTQPQKDDKTSTRKVLNRLKRARGQVDAVIRAVEEGEDCRKVITQLSAATAAMQRAGFAMIAATMRDCLNKKETEHDIDELERLFLSLG